MSDLKERVGYMTGGNANLIPYEGAIICGDGEQTVYLMHPGVAGKVLTSTDLSDPTKPEGMEWADAAGGGASLSLAFSSESDVQNDSSEGDEVVCEAVVNFDQFTPGATLDLTVGFVGYGNQATPVTNPRLKVFVGATASQNPAGGTEVINVGFGSTTTPTVGHGAGTIVSPTGYRLVQITIRGGTFGEGPEDFTGSARSIVLQISEES